MLIVRALAEVDLELLTDWLNAPHLRPFYMQEPISSDDVRKKFAPRIDTAYPVTSLIVEFDGEPFGYTQWYLNASFPDYGAATIGETAGVSFDYFVGSTDHLGKHRGSAMLDVVVAQVLSSVEDTQKIFFVGHQNTNLRAIRCSIRAGFAYHKDFVEKGAPSTLYARDERQNASYYFGTLCKGVYHEHT